MYKKGIITFCLLLATQLTAFAQSFETATEAVENMGPGWNLGNTLDANNGNTISNIVTSETMWGQPVTKKELMVMMKDAGFGAIRVPVTWYSHMDSKGKVDAKWMARVHEVVDYVLDAGLYCILNVHHDTGADSDSHKSWLKADETVYNNVKAKYEYLWQQIAEEFKDYGERLLFESYNEMLDTYNSWCFASFNTSDKYNSSVATSAYNAINSYAQSFVDVVRATGSNNAKRNLVVNTYGACSGSGTWNNHLKDPLSKMNLPSDNTAGAGHLIFQIHNYPNISNITNAKAEIDDMLKAVKTNLIAKGAPVIIGEWGTSDSNKDYLERPSQMFEYVDYFVQKSKEYGIGTFYWMGLSDGSSRSLPAFTQPDLAECIVKAWRGSSFEGKYPTIKDYDIIYHITYNADWQEANLCTSTISLSNYKGIRVEMAEIPAAGALQIKCYGESNGKEQYEMLSSTSKFSELTFNSSKLGSTVKRITLQTYIGAQTVKLKSAWLIRKDGTVEELTSFSPFWGCSVEMQHQAAGIQQITVDAPKDTNIYNMQGQRVTTPVVPGIYIQNGKKFIVK